MPHLNPPTFFNSLWASPLLIVLLLLLSSSGCSRKPAVIEEVRPVRAITLAASQQQVLAEYAGNVQPRIEARLGFRVSGKVSTRKVDVGTLVKAGQVLMQLDPNDLRLAQQQAEGNFKTAESNLVLANNELKRFQELRKSNAVSQSMLDAKLTAAESAQGAFEQAQAQLKGQTNQSAYANLVATSAGVVTAINVEVGQVVSAGMPVVHVAQLGEMEVEVGIPENNVDVISRANRVQIQLWANAQESIPGKIREISPMADPATRTFMARISILSPSPKVVAAVKMGMTANVQFGLNTASAFVKVPLTALFQENGVTSVWIVENERVKLVPVQIGSVSGNDLLLASGVSEGQVVVTAGVHLLKPQQRVTILEEIVAENHTEPYLSTQTLLNAAQNNHKTPAVKPGAEK